MSITIFVEGGGHGRLRKECRMGFRTFLEKAGFQGRMPQIVPCGSRDIAYDQFKTAYEENENCLLLVDAEESITEGHTPWQHLQNSDQYTSHHHCKLCCF